MSHADKNIFGLEHGKIGNRIAVVLHGKQIYKSYYKPTNPRTPKQQMHRAKIAFINRLAKDLADAVNIGFLMVPKKDSGLSPRNAFVKKNWNNGALVWLENDPDQTNNTSDEILPGEWGVCPERLCLADGPRFIATDMRAEVRDGRLHISCPTPGLRVSNAVSDDQLLVAVYRPAVHIVHLFKGPMRDKCDECDFALPSDVGGEDDPLHVYAWFQATAYHCADDKKTVSPNQASPSLYLGNFTI